MIRYLLIMGLLCAGISDVSAQPGKDRHTLWIGQYKLKFDELKPSSRVKIAHTKLCIEEFDFVYLEDYVLQNKRMCDQRVATVEKDKDEACEGTKKLIRTRCAEMENLLKNQVNDFSLKLKNKQAELDTMKSAHKIELRNHYIVGIALSVVLISVTTIAIVY